MLIEASITLRDLREDYHVMLPKSPEYETLEKTRKGVWIMPIGLYITLFIVIPLANALNPRALVNVNEQVGRHVRVGQCGDTPPLMRPQGRHGR